MTIIIDASPIIGLVDKDDRRRWRVADLLASHAGRLIIPAPVTAEIDYLLEARAGKGANLPFLEDLASGAFEVQCLVPEEYSDVVALQRKYLGFAPGLADLSLADLSIVVLARRFNTRRILTFDERHFRAMTRLQGGEFEILPGSGDGSA